MLLLFLASRGKEQAFKACEVQPKVHKQCTFAGFTGQKLLRAWQAGGPLAGSLMWDIVQGLPLVLARLETSNDSVLEETRLLGAAP